MRYLFLLISLLALIQAAQVEAKDYTCTIVTGYGTAIGRGPSQLKAKEEARFICGGELIEMHIRKYKTLDDEKIDDLVLACANLECQK